MVQLKVNGSDALLKGMNVSLLEASVHNVGRVVGLRFHLVKVELVLGCLMMILACWIISGSHSSE